MVLKLAYCGRVEEAGGTSEVFLDRGRKFVSGKSNERAIIISKSFFFLSISQGPSGFEEEDAAGCLKTWRNGVENVTSQYFELKYSV